jgi:hypothetical protein
MVGVLKVATLIHAVVLGAPGANAVPEGEAGFGTDEAPSGATPLPVSPGPGSPTPAPLAPAAPNQATPPAPADAAAPSSPPVSSASPARAQAVAPRQTTLPPVEEPLKKRPPHRVVSLTFSPLHLLSPIFEIEAELAMAPHFGVGVIGGIGTMNTQTVNPNYPDQDFSVYELGGQVIGYPLREFSSLQVGAEVMWIHVNASTYQGQSVEANAGGVAVGPFVGYKVLTDIGFTFVAQGGFQYVAVNAHASDSEGNSARAESSDFVPLLNLNLGWSF